MFRRSTWGCDTSSGLVLGAFTKMFTFGDWPLSVAGRLYSLRSDLRQKSRRKFEGRLQGLSRDARNLALTNRVRLVTSSERSKAACYRLLLGHFDLCGTEISEGGYAGVTEL
jgi:hypothetical protein